MEKIFLTITNQISGHGSFSRQERMAQALVKKGHKVYWISPPGYAAPNINTISLSLNKLPNFAFIGLYFKLILTFLKNYKVLKNIDVVFTVREYDALCVIMNPFFWKIPKIFLSRGDTISIYKVNQPDIETLNERLRTWSLLLFYPYIQKIVLKFSDLVVLQAKFLREILKKRHQKLSFKSKILNNDCLELDNVSSSDSEIKTINLAFISPLFWECKGLGIIVEMVSELTRRKFNYKLHIIGDGPHKNRMKDALDGTQGSNNIMWHGWLEKFEPIINSIDLVIVPSLYDSNPNLILEMLSHNKSLLASDIPAHKEMLCYDELLFENKNISELVEKIMLFQSSVDIQNIVKTKLSERKNKLTFDWDSELVNILESELLIKALR